jgi:hypothetical protein
MRFNRFLIAAALLAVLGMTAALADIARPKPSPEKPVGKIVHHTGLTIVPDSNASEARLQISQGSLKYLQAALNGVPANPTFAERVAQSSTRTMIAGLFLCLSVSFAGVWLARSRFSKSQKTLATLLLVVGLVGTITVITRANAGPPGYYRWANLPQNLRDGNATSGGLDIEIVQEDQNMKLIIPLRKTTPPTTKRKEDE